jgi:hypothetical protein
MCNILTVFVPLKLAYCLEIPRKADRDINETSSL